MARPKVGAWYRAGKDAWYGYIAGKAVSLGVQGKANKLAAQEAYFRLLGGGEPPVTRVETPQSVRCVVRSVPTVGELSALFLADATARLAELSVRNYTTDMGRFTARFGDVPADQVEPLQLIHWFRSRKVADSTRKICMSSVSAFFGWCVRAGHLADNPMRRVPRPRTHSRAERAVISPDEHAKLIAAASPWMRNVLILLHATGCRPGELCRIAVENFDAKRGVVTLHEHKTANKTDRPRLIVVPPAECELLAKLATEMGRGPILRMLKGKPWSARRITERMQKLKEQTGVRKFAYGYRHMFVTDALSGGTSEAITAALVGHSSTVMIHKFYSGLGSQVEVLRKAVCGFRGGRSVDGGSDAADGM